MSADSHTPCPKCHPDLVGKPGVTPALGEELGYGNDVRENVEYYMLDGTHIVFKYSANCWECGWGFEYEHKEQIPGLASCANCPHPLHDGICGYILSQDIDDTVGVGLGEPSGEIITIATGICPCLGKSWPYDEGRQESAQTGDHHA